MTKIPKLVIAHLYPDDMNIYGDTGNKTILLKRLEWRKIPYELHAISAGDALPQNVDIILGGGGQDASQGGIEQDFLRRKDELKKLADENVVMLMICGMYQLLGRKFITIDGTTIHGLGILPVETRAKKGRLIGNIVTESKEFGLLVGYENHSGRTYLDDDATPLSTVRSGKGNDDASGKEGCHYKNIFATYMHGPVLSKNPKLADALIVRALQRHGYDEPLIEIDDSIELSAQKVAIARPR